jgi:hypothetical protein
MVALAEPRYCSSPVPHGKTSGSNQMSSGSTPKSSREDLVAAARDLELALDGHRHAALVDEAHDERGAVALRERHHLLEALETVFEVDRVEDRLALAPGERALHHLARRWSRSSAAP